MLREITLASRRSQEEGFMQPSLCPLCHVWTHGPHAIGVCVWRDTKSVAEVKRREGGGESDRVEEALETRIKLRSISTIANAQLVYRASFVRFNALRGTVIIDQLMLHI